jgi:hypothetical protein
MPIHGYVRLDLASRSTIRDANDRECAHAGLPGVGGTEIAKFTLDIGR